MLPSVSFAQPSELRPISKPVKRVMNIDPCIIFFCQHNIEFRIECVSNVDDQPVLQAIELLDHQTCFINPLHARQVVVSFVARNGQPCGLATSEVHHSDSRSRVDRSDFGIGNVLNLGIERVGIVDQWKGLDS